MNSNKTAFDLVKTFYIDSGMVVNDKPTIVDYDTIRLRINMHEEEYDELQDELDILEEGGYGSLEDQLARVAKESADLITVVCGTLVSLGMDAETVCQIVMMNNMEKIQYGMKRADGKVIVPDEVSSQLKENVHKQLVSYIKDVREGKLNGDGNSNG